MRATSLVRCPLTNEESAHSLPHLETMLDSETQEDTPPSPDRLFLSLATPSSRAQQERPLKLYAKLQPNLISLEKTFSEYDTPSRRAERKLFCEQQYASLACDLQPGEIRSVIIPQKGSKSSISSYIFSEDQVETDKWRFGYACLYNVPYIIVLNANIKTGVNKVASKLLRGDVHGPIILILLDHDYIPTHMSLPSFKKLVRDLL